MASPATSTATINDLIPGVQAALQNRSDASEGNPNPKARPSYCIQTVLKEVTKKWPFEELRVIGPFVIIGPGLGQNGSTYIYPISMFLNSGDDYTRCEDPTIFLNPSMTGPGIPNSANTVAYAMDYLTPKAMQPLLFIQGGVPFKYTRWGSNFWFGSQPGQNYTVYLPYQIRHPFSDNLVSSPVQVPSDWIPVIEYMAAELLAVTLRWNDQSDFLHKKVYGDPDSQMKDGSLGQPGLLAALIPQQEIDARLSMRQIVPFCQRY